MVVIEAKRTFSIILRNNSKVGLQSMVVIETWMADIAKTCNISQRAVRELNFLKDGDRTAFNQLIQDCHVRRGGEGDEEQGQGEGDEVQGKGEGDEESGQGERGEMEIE